MPFDVADDYSIEILSHLPKGKKVVMGLIDAHSPFPDDKDAIIRFVRKAKRHINPAFLAISPKTDSACLATRHAVSSTTTNGLKSNP